MGWLFKTPSDDATEATLRALHTQNMLDNYYERGRALLLCIIVGFGTAFAVSAFELKTGISVWENTVEWAYDKIEGWIQSW
jgi:hypothetical protein